MFRFVSLSIVGLLAFGGSAFAEAPCAYYDGHMDVETRIGNRRDIGEASLFLPLSCSEDTLLFSDMRFKLDDSRNREGNLALGIRHMRETGIVGAYAYFDRKRSGVTGKYHNQATAGAEWLAEGWEIRSNLYIPLSGAQSVQTQDTSFSRPFLADTGIYIEEKAARLLTEKGLYGGDVEAGLKIPGSDFWMHAGAFSFHGDGAASLDGARTRATWNITDTFALTAEGQYDDERGRQGWLGARVTIPFGDSSQKPRGLKARMTASPVRDVDIVTGTKVAQVGEDKIVPVLNAATGTAQRVLYVDNAQAVSGAGTLENPFNNLADAQAALQSHDVLYIAAGTGTNVGMQTGLLIATQNDVQVIGEGSAFVYDGGRFTANTGRDYTGMLLRTAGMAPVIGNSGGHGITIGASDVLVSGLRVENATGHGVYVMATGGNDLSGITLHNLSVANSAQDGIRIEASGAGSTATATLLNVAALNNKNGIRFYAANNAAVTGALQSSRATGNAQHGVIVYDDSASGTVDTDLGGGGRSAGNNALYGNGLEDLALDIDGGTLFAQNNWWGQAAGLYQSAPAGGLKPQIYYGAPLDDGLVGHWTFDSEWTTNTTAYDRSGNNNHGTLSGGLSLANMVSGNKRQAFDFNASGRQIIIPDSATLDITGDLTILTYLDKDATLVGYAAHPINKWNNTVDANYVLYDFGTTAGVGATDRYQFFANRGGVWNPISGPYTSPPANGMEYIALSYRTATGGQLYVNAGAVGGLGGSGNLATNNAPVRLGAASGFDGKMDDVRIYNRALSASEVAELYRMSTNSLVDFSAYRVSAP